MMFSAIPQRTAENRFVERGPSTAPEITCVVESGIEATLITRSTERRRPQPLLPLRPVPSEIPDFQAYSGERVPEFANEAELECAKILDYYRVPWDYEPRTFVLEEDGEGRVVEAFTPDFYLPEQDLYVEVTVMKQSLVTRKNRKLRKLRERYPEIKIRLFYKRDIERLAERYHLNLAS